MTHTGPARPTDRNIARFGQFQKALEGRCLPVRGDATARERDQRTGVGVADPHGHPRVVEGHLDFDRARGVHDRVGHQLADEQPGDVELAQGAKGRRMVFSRASRVGAKGQRPAGAGAGDGSNAETSGKVDAAEEITIAEGRDEAEEVG